MISILRTRFGRFNALPVMKNVLDIAGKYRLLDSRDHEITKIIMSYKSRSFGSFDAWAGIEDLHQVGSIATKTNMAKTSVTPRSLIPRSD